jgi:hypothetical protein
MSALEISMVALFLARNILTTTTDVSEVVLYKFYD